MLNRRSARIKVMQGLYALNRNDALNVEVAHKELDRSMQAFINAYYFIFYSAVEVIDFINTDASIKAAKHLPTAEDKELNLKLLDNLYYTTFNNHAELNEIAHLDGFNKKLPGHIVSAAYKKLTDSPEYNSYISNPISEAKDDQRIFTFLIMKVLLDDDVFLQHMEDIYSNWYDDNDMIAGILQKRLKANKIGKLIYNKDSHWEETYNFAKNLLFKTADNKAHLSEVIGKYLSNWDTKRLALMDTILLEMATSELLYFPEIPVKVTINEYIDISKEYSTPKSKDFINGVLDKLMKELAADGQINKTGRGLKN